MAGNDSNNADSHKRVTHTPYPYQPFYFSYHRHLHQDIKLHYLQTHRHQMHKHHHTQIGNDDLRLRLPPSCFPLVGLVLDRACARRYFQTSSCYCRAGRHCHKAEMQNTHTRDNEQISLSVPRPEIIEQSIPLTLGPPIGPPA